MLKTKVIADNILNLTDARYFAAFGVDYMIFNLSNIKQEDIKEINEWVEGVEILLELNTAITPMILDFIFEISPAGFVSSVEEVLLHLKDQFSDKLLFLRSGDLVSSGEHNLLLDAIDHIESKPDGNQKIFVKVSGQGEALQKILESDVVDGIVVEGEPEEKIGFKNFDELDEIFERLIVEV